MKLHTKIVESENTVYVTVDNENQERVIELQIQSGHYRFWQNGSLQPWNETKGEKQKDELKEIADDMVKNISKHNFPF